MILEIDYDASTGKATVEGKTEHSHRGRGGGTLKWMCDPQRGQGWRVRFTAGSPFRDGRLELSGTNRPDGGVLKDVSRTERYPYDVWCTDTDGVEYDTDPEVVLEPE